MFSLAECLPICESLSLKPLATIWEPHQNFQYVSHAPDSSIKNAETQIKRNNLMANRGVQSTNFDSPIEYCCFKIAETAVQCFLSALWNLGACACNNECVRVGTTGTYLMQQFKVWSLAVLFARLFVKCAESFTAREVDEAPKEAGVEVKHVRKQTQLMNNPETTTELFYSLQYHWWVLL